MERRILSDFTDTVPKQNSNIVLQPLFNIGYFLQPSRNFREYGYISFL